MKAMMMLVAALCLFCLSTTQALGVNPCARKGGNLGDDGKCTMRTQLYINIDYPLELAQTPLVADTIDPFIQALKDGLIRCCVENFIPGSGIVELTMTYNTVHHSSDIFTLVFSIYEYGGGAHGDNDTQTFTFDLANNRLVTLDDLFAPNSDPFAVIAPIVEAAISAGVGGDPVWI